MRSKKPPKGMMVMTDSTQGGIPGVSGTAKKLKPKAPKPAPKAGFKMFRRKTP